MADHPARRGFDPDEEVSDGAERGWGSPMPAEYGSLTSFLPPMAEPRSTPTAPPAGERARRLRPVKGRGRKEDPAGGADAAPDVTGVSPAGRGADATIEGRPAGRTAPDARSAQVRAPRATRTEAAVAPGPAATTSAEAVAEPVGVMRAPAGRGRTTSGGSGGAAPGVAVGVAAGAGLATGWAEVPPADRTSPSGPRPMPKERGRAARKARRRKWAMTRGTIRHFNVVSVIKVSVVFYLIVLASVVVASVLLWYAANALGSVQSIEKSIKTLFDLKTFTLHPANVAKFTAAGGAVLAVAGTIFNVLAAFTYNLISDAVGGIRFEVVSDAPGEPL